MRRKPLSKNLRYQARTFFTGVHSQVILSKNVAYFPVPKIASSLILAVFLKNNANAKDFDPNKMSAFMYLKEHRGCTVAHLSQIRRSNAAVISVIRHPAKRLVSSFVNKFLGSDISPLIAKKFSEDASKILKRKIDAEELRFRDFLLYCFSLPDWRRDIHYRTQKSFLPKQLNYLFDIDHINNLWDFLQENGFDISFARDFKPEQGKRTSYAEPNEFPGADSMPLAELRLLEKYPYYTDFFDEKMLDKFITKYAEDMNIYCNMANISVHDFRASVLPR